MPRISHAADFVANRRCKGSNPGNDGAFTGLRNFSRRFLGRLKLMPAFRARIGKLADFSLAAWASFGELAFFLNRAFELQLVNRPVSVYVAAEIQH